jgi:ABC-type glycerol-3-phosphate transport system substrate-binding protein
LASHALSEDKDAAWRFLRYYTGAEGAETWKDWALPTVQGGRRIVRSVRGSHRRRLAQRAKLPGPRAYVFTPYWGQTADPALRRVLESVILDPNADVAALLDHCRAGRPGGVGRLLAQE